MDDYREENSHHSHQNENNNVTSHSGMNGLLWDETPQQIGEEIARALQNIVPFSMEHMENAIDNAFENRMMKLSQESPVEEVKMKANEIKEKPKKYSCTFTEFMACKPKEFMGQVDPLISQRWVADMESMFEISHCDPSDEVIISPVVN